MKKTTKTIIFLILILIVSCSKENTNPVEEVYTFIKTFGGSGNDRGKVVIEDRNNEVQLVIQKVHKL